MHMSLGGTYERLVRQHAVINSIIGAFRAFCSKENVPRKTAGSNEILLQSVGNAHLCS